MTDVVVTPRLSLARAAMVGVPALLVALATGHLAAAFIAPEASPYLAVGNTVIDLSPPWLVEFAKDAFGTANKVVLFAGMAVVLLAVAVFAGWLSRRKVAPGLLVVVAFGLAGFVAVVTRPDLGPLAALAPVVSLLCGAAAFAWLHARALSAQYEEADEATVDAAEDPAATMVRGEGSPSRRRLLIGSAGVLAGAGVAGAAGQWLAGPDVEASRRAVGSFRGLKRAAAVPGSVDFVADGTPSMITANKDFYTIHTAFVVPRLRAEDWQLTVHGMVERPLTLSYAELRERPLVERTLTMSCVSNPVGGDLISTANFIGVDLADLLAEAGIKPGAEQLFSTSSDGFTAGSPIDVVADPKRGAMLAVGMNGVPLPVEHGFPVRIVVPGLYGYVSATKWLVDLEVTTWKARTQYWIPRGWSRLGPVKTQSRIDRATVSGGVLTVAGIAWAPHIGIDQVEVQVDEGPWQQAELADELSVDTWRMWRAKLDVGDGEHTVRCRATDRKGYTQTPALAPVAPDGATGWHTVSATVT